MQRGDGKRACNDTHVSAPSLLPLALARRNLGIGMGTWTFINFTAFQTSDILRSTSSVRLLYMA